HLGLRGETDNPPVEPAALELRQRPTRTPHLTELGAGPGLNDDEIADVESRVRRQVVLGDQRLAQTNTDKGLRDLGESRLGDFGQLTHAPSSRSLARKTTQQDLDGEPGRDIALEREPGLAARRETRDQALQRTTTARWPPGVGEHGQMGGG